MRDTTKITFVGAQGGGSRLYVLYKKRRWLDLTSDGNICGKG